jgi:hypothetical protein
LCFCSCGSVMLSITVGVSFSGLFVGIAFMFSSWFTLQ